jgi:hypothetical protein
MRYLLVGCVGVVVAVLLGCGPSTTLTRGPFMDVSWAPGEHQTASAGESIAWWRTIRDFAGDACCEYGRTGATRR